MEGEAEPHSIQFNSIHIFNFQKEKKSLPSHITNICKYHPIYQLIMLEKFRIIFVRLTFNVVLRRDSFKNKLIDILRYLNNIWTIVSNSFMYITHVVDCISYILKDDSVFRER